MLLFPIYALAIWFFAGRWRRSWKGFLSVLVGTVFLVMLELLLYKLQVKRIAGLAPEQAIGLLLIFTPIVTSVGLFIACLPQAAPSEVHCKKCFYDLTGLDPVDLRCPECGAMWKGVGSGYIEDGQANVAIVEPPPAPYAAAEEDADDEETIIIIPDFPEPKC